MRIRLLVAAAGGLSMAALAAFFATEVLHAEEAPAALAHDQPAPTPVSSVVGEPTPDQTAEDPTPTKPDDAPSDAEPDESEDESDEVWVGPPDVIPDCEAKLAEAGIEYKPSRIPLHKTKSGITCGAAQVVRYTKGPGGISWGNPQVTCGVALGMAKLEGIIQEEAERHLGRRVKRIKHMGTYSCREMANYPGWVSEHSYANAIDIKYFALTNGKEIPVLGKYPRDGAEPKDAAGRFLRAVARRTYDEHAFSVVLTPSFDRIHRNHFHLDMARYLVDGT
ncbi:extensin family protein [Paraliomyxa miuraensis]|uniref:extensin family protein n=1 Tax=Paraliomyxa miuraensis TaxID=376150 RepID=UPI00225061F5|nr:extensin family protein [Paraliomyxa miuraensis]MCX4242392.1 extensin family protein [Paraliomyxa miuraensis]